MSIIVKFPTPLQSFVGGKGQVEITEGSIQEVMNRLEEQYPGIKNRLCDESGELRRFINLFVNEEEVRHLNGLDTLLKKGDTLSIIPAIAGGVGQTFQDKLKDLKKNQKETTVERLKERMDKAQKLVLLDVRESDEFRRGHLPGATHLPRGFLEMKVETMLPDRQTPLVLYCGSGTRSLFAAETLEQMGYEKIESLVGGFGAWSQRGFPIEIPVSLSESDRNRYSRHLAIPEVGEKGQMKLLNSKVLLLGAGGLGCPSAFYLAAAGVGTMGIVDFDVVDESNLQRQILHTTDRVGTSKIQSAVKTLKAFNPGVKIIPFEERLESTNVERILQDFDIIVDGSDNFPTRYLINDACVKLKKPCVHGSVYRFEGQVSVFSPAKGGPCYRCLYEEPPPPEMAPSCAEAGVLGVLPGIIGLLEAVETLKLILEIGDPLIGRLITYDALATKFQEFKLRKNPDCAYCGQGKEFPGYIDYVQFCSNGNGRANKRPL